MFLSFLLFLGLLTLLFLLSQKITNYIYSFFYLLSKSEKFSVGLLCLFLLPGTLTHELSHFFMATILRVPTGRLSVWPTLEKAGPACAGRVVKTGRLELAQTDPFRRTLIGLAPLIIGLTLVYFIGKFLLPALTQLSTINYQLSTIIFLFAICYLLFSISSTMFSSRKDLESLIIAGPILFLFLISFQLVGIKILLDDTLIKKINLIISGLNSYLLIAAVLDYLVFFLLAVNLSLWQKIFRK